MALTMFRKALVVATLLATSTSAAVLDSRIYENAGLTSVAARGKGWPYGPFKTEGRDIVNAKGEKITWVGINWPMSGETMIPEGLEKRSAEDILDDIASLGMNFIRMGWSTTMVDEIADSEDENYDVSLEKAMAQGLGKANGTRVTADVLKYNPSWTEKTGRFEIWSDVVRAAEKRGIYVHPDMHIARAGWCCSHIDQSAWFGDDHFNVGNWTRALAHVARWAAGHDNIVSMALVNELRQPWEDNYPRYHYGWETLVGNMTLGSDAIHAANPDLLISWSGLQFDEDLSALTSGLNLHEAPCYMCVATRDAPRREPLVFDLADHAWGDKVFYELHLYPMSEDLDTGTCGIIKAQLYRAGFNALGMEPPSDCALLENSPLGPCRPAVRRTPVLMTEFGAAQDASLLKNPYIACLREFTTENAVGWSAWSLAGSFRARSGGQDVDDTWGLKSFDWEEWRSQEGVEEVWKPWVKESKPTRKCQKA